LLDRFLSKATVLNLKDFISPSAQRTTTHAHTAKKNKTTGSRYNNKNPPDIGDYGLTGNACFNDKDEEIEIERQARETCGEDCTRKARKEDRTRKAREARELEEIKIEHQAHEANEEIERQDQAVCRQIELQHLVMHRTRRMQAERQANHIYALPTAVSSAAIASVSSAAIGQNSTPSAVISSPDTTQQQQQQQQQEGKTRRVVPPLIVDVDLTSEVLVTPLGIKTNGLDTSLSTPMRILSGDDAPAPSAYAGT
jgi:hypothetical protein